MLSDIKKFMHMESAGGICLLAAMTLAMIMANSPLADAYKSFISLPVVASAGELTLAKPLLLWVNDGLMAVFFFLVGLEIKREILGGQLSDPASVVLPGIAALAGIAAPALIYVAFNQGDADAMRGWAIPTATDIAFALGIFTLFGKHLPLSLKLFLLSVAIFDDIGAIIIIAVFYSSDLAPASLIIACSGWLILFALNRFGVTNVPPYLIVGVIIWVAVLKSGVHATLAGFINAWFVPMIIPPRGDGAGDGDGDGAGDDDDDNQGEEHIQHESMLHKLEHGLHPWVAFLVLPLFAFANTGIVMEGMLDHAAVSTTTLGIIAGLFLGKQLGIFSACWLAIKLGLAKRPAGASWLQLYAVSVLCGVGFTMSLFIGTLAFEAYGLAYLRDVKIGVMIGSLLSVVVAAVLLRLARSPQAVAQSQ